MNDEQIEALAVKVMGWKRCQNGWGLFHLPEKYCDGPSGKCYKNPDNWTTPEYEPWKPHENIAAAWQVVEKIVGSNDGEGPGCEIRVLKGRPAPGRVWAKFVRMPGGPFEAYAPSAPEAICLAAIKAVEAR